MKRHLAVLAALILTVSCSRAEYDFPPALSAPSPDQTSNLYSVTWLEHRFPAEVGRNASVLAAMKFRNSSESVWNNFVRLTYVWVSDPSQVASVHGEHRIDLGRPVAPGATVFLELIPIETPSAPGSYRLKFELVNELVAWFSDRGGEVLSFSVVVR